uniref:M23 family metallopeptidase n=1 Tax=Gemmiger sp. TaxID=2049027 RepID=UPI003FF0BBB5
QEDNTYTVFTLSYVGDDYFADTVWQLDDKQKSCADAYAHNLTVYLHEIEEHEGITILGQINDALIDDTSPAPSGGFGNPFNDPNWEQHITSFFGKREDVGIPGKDTTNHNGLDIAYPYGTPILAVEGGTVIKSGYHVSYGNYLVINHGGGYCTLYAHCSQLLAQVSDTVNKYDTIAKVGATGDVTGNHLHICVIIDGVYVNPKGYLH